jgi:acylphosphatase
MAAEEVVTKRYLVRGRVQAVGFRWYARDAARALGVQGTVRNLPDGRTVEVVARAQAGVLERFAEALRRGPPGAHVSELIVEIATEDVAGEGFHILA